MIFILSMDNLSFIPIWCSCKYYNRYGRWKQCYINLKVFIIDTRHILFVLGAFLEESQFPIKPDVPELHFCADNHAAVTSDEVKLGRRCSRNLTSVLRECSVRTIDLSWRSRTPVPPRSAIAVFYRFYCTFGNCVYTAYSMCEHRRTQCTHINKFSYRSWLFRRS